MAITINKGRTWADGDTVTPTRLNETGTPTITLATATLMGRSTAGTGTVEEIACTAAGRALLDDADADAQLTTLGGTAAGVAMFKAADAAAQLALLVTGGTVVESDIVNSKGVSKTESIDASSSESVLFDTANAPSITLTAGTWIVAGACGYNAQEMSLNWFSFHNVTDAADFGASGAMGNTSGTSDVRPIPVFGTVTIASGSKVIKFRAHVRNPNGTAKNIILGTSDSDTPSGYLFAAKLFA